MVKIRLSRTGRTHYATYKIVVSPAREKRDSDFIEQLGFYNPHSKELTINKERAEYWLSVGAQPTDTVKYLMIKQEILKADPKKKPFKKTAGKKATERATKKAEKTAESTAE